jgi:hypothetical protein
MRNPHPKHEPAQHRRIIAYVFACLRSWHDANVCLSKRVRITARLPGEDIHYVLHERLLSHFPFRAGLGG